MDIFEAMQNRHSVRQYTDKPIEPEKIDELKKLIGECNRDSGLHLQLVTNEPKAFDGTMAHYGKFSGVTDYIALVGSKSVDLEEKCGYYGEKVVLEAQMLGLNTCWVGLTFSKISDAFTVNKGEKLVGVISVGYGTNSGVPHNSKAVEKLCSVQGDMPEWFKRGMDAAMLAPTAMNQQKFKFMLNGSKVAAKAGGGFFTKVDLGIAKYHFELGAGKENFEWE